jgi:hypothetical protein
MPGIKTTMAGVQFSAGHIQNAQKVSQDVASASSLVALHCNELIKHLGVLLASCPAGDTANIATLNAQIAALS